MTTISVKLATQQSIFILFVSLCVLVATVRCQQQQQQFPTAMSSNPTTEIAAAALLPSPTTTIPTLKKSLVEASSCGINGNIDTICSPKEGEVWQNGTWYPIVWNSMHPAYVSTPTIDIYVYFVQNYETTLIKTLPNIDVSKGTVPVLVDDTWRLNPTGQTYESMIYIVPSGVNPDDEIHNRNSDYPPPVSNFVKQLELNPLTTSSATNPSFSSGTPTSLSTFSVTSQETLPSTNSFPSTDKHANSESNGFDGNKKALPFWIIAVICLAACAVTGSCAFALWFVRRSKQRKLVYGEKDGFVSANTLNSSLYPAKSAGKYGDEDGKSADGSRSNMLLSHNHLNSSMILSHPDITTLAGTPVSISPSRSYYTAPQYHPTKLSGYFNNITSNDSNNKVLDAWSRPQLTNSASNLSSRSEPPPLITSTDAIMIADTFRQRMRRPDWQQQPHKMSKEEEEEEKRRKLSEQLMKEELEAEGTLMKKVGKRAQLTPSIYHAQQ